MSKRFFRPFLFVAALVMAAFSTNLLPATAAGATGGHNPGGNNGFVKVNGTKFDDIPNNEPHVGCTFRLEFYNYDRNSGHAQVSFELQSPTKGPGYALSVTGGDLTPYIGSDGNGGSNDLDADESYKLNFTCAPHQNQGYHVKLTVTAQGTNGNNTKHKVFWVQPCAKPIIDTRVSSCVDRPNNTGKVIVNVANPNVTSLAYAVTLGATTQNITLGGQTNQDVVFNNVIPGTHTVTVTGNNGTQKTTTVTIADCLPLEPVITISDEVCSDPFNTIFAGSAKVTIENTNYQTVSYSLTLGGITKTIVLNSQTSGSVTFVGLQSGNHALTVTGSDDTNVHKTVTIPVCQPETPHVIAEPLGCSLPGQHLGSGVVHVTNPNNYSVAYDVTVAGVTQSVSVAAHGSGYVIFNGLSVGPHTATVVGNNNTRATADFEVEECLLTPGTPTLGLTANCITPGTTGSLTVKITNNDAFGNNYAVAINGGTAQFVHVQANSSTTLAFNSLIAGTYTVSVNTTGLNNVATADISLAHCPGQTLGTSTTRTVTTLPKTGANGSIGLLFALLAASVTYTIVLAIEKRRLATASNK